MEDPPTDGQRSTGILTSRRSRREAEEAAIGMENSEPENDELKQSTAKKSHRFRNWRRQRPFVGGLLVIIGGIELFFSGQLDTGNLQIQFGIEGLQATVVPIALVALGLFATYKPTHHMFYGIIALVLAVYSLVGVNLGGFIIGMLLSTIGAILVVAWMGPRDKVAGTEGQGPGKPAADAPRSEDQETEEFEALSAERRGDAESASEEESS
ncbi:DUF6114 domain-containing protein [Brevibacterium aurantiacum]|uniref:DUF6114 domain-containing protein n=1 Tax=Brevibacterium aurantiacum TaxID=273384 RepID=UPI0016431383|nr:DUF6114 domain-containing protein [Brevibacterium aurantiacum]